MNLYILLIFCLEDRYEIRNTKYGIRMLLDLIYDGVHFSYKWKIFMFSSALIKTYL